MRVIDLDRGSLILSDPEAVLAHIPVEIPDLPFMAATAIRADIDALKC